MLKDEKLFYANRFCVKGCPINLTIRSDWVICVNESRTVFTQITFVLNDEKLFHANPFCVNNSGVILTKSNHKAKKTACTARRFYYYSLFSFSFKAASTNPLNNGCGLVGLDLNSGWNTAPI